MNVEEMTEEELLGTLLFAESFKGSWSLPDSDDPTLPESDFDPEGSGYDYATARAVGLSPDETGHWPSRDPRTGIILKGRNHPTFHKTVAGAKKAGYKLIKNEKTGRWFSVPVNSRDIMQSDAPGIGHVIMNRVENSNWPNNIRDVIYQEDQFSGVGNPEWNKVINDNLDESEKKKYNLFKSLAGGITSGAYADPTGEADHYYNPAISDPSWGSDLTETYNTTAHRYGTLPWSEEN